MHDFVKHIKEVTGLSMGEFCEKELKTDYKAFNWRLKQSRLYPDEILYMIWRTRRTVQELFGKPWHELIIDNSNGPVVKDVKEILSKLSKKETRELERLMGLEPYKARAGERNQRKKAEEVAERLAKSPITPAEATPEEPKSQAPETKEEDPFRKIFKDTYGTE